GRAGWMTGAQRLGAFRWPILLWCVASFLAVLWSPDIVQGFGLWRAFILEPVLLLFVIAHEFQDQYRRGFLRLSMYALVWAMAGWGLFEYLTGLGIPSPWNVPLGEGRRATGPFPFPNALALLTAPIGAYAFARWIKKFQVSSFKFQAEFFTFGAALLAALVARSDGALVALVAVALGLLLLEKRFRLIGVGIVTIGVIALTALPAVRSEVWQEATFQSWSGRVRVWMWEETWTMLKERPITGAGFGGYQTVIAPYHQKDFIEIFEYPHTIVFNTWSETGLLGLIAFVWILFVWLRGGRFAGGEYWYASVAIVGAIVIHGLVDVPYFKNDLAIAFWMLLFLSVGLLD
ncbi:MAG: O-antigen ligase family protein, partial [Candidatus Uhrbacteria bacterium]|nr:O-antigen ligase family protein [Candidatus Uhrbacteria bacterium]